MQDDTALEVVKNAEIVESPRINTQLAHNEINIDELSRRADQINKIKNVALKVTKASDWLDQNNVPYLSEKGCDRLMGLFGISFELIKNPSIEYDKDGHFQYTCTGRFSMQPIFIDAIGSKSSRDPFYSIHYVDGIKQNKPPTEIDKTRIMKHALTNCMVNGITRLLGIKGLGWDDLAEAGIKKDSVGNVNYRNTKTQNSYYSKKETKTTENKSQKEVSSDQKESITEGQLKYLKSLLTQLNINKEQALTYCTEIIKREIKSSKELTKIEAINVIKFFKNELEEYKTKDNFEAELDKVFGEDTR